MESAPGVQIMASLKNLLLVAMSWLLTVSACALDVTLQAPLTTLVPVPGILNAGARELTAIITVPADAPTDLGVGAYLMDHEGRWWQRFDVHPLRAGTQRVRVLLGENEPVIGTASAWSPTSAATATRAGLFFWSTSGSRTILAVNRLTAAVIPTSISDEHRLVDFASDRTQVATSERWSLHVRPQPYPANPYDATEFSLTLVVTRPDGQEERLTGFHDQPMRAADRGDIEEVVAEGRARFTVRYRPRVPGVHRLRLESRWNENEPQSTSLPNLEVSGVATDPYVRIDHGDPRFFSIGDKFWWPIGPNLRSVTDPRSGENLATKATPLRGTLAYDAYLARLSANGVDAIELWLSSWGLAMEWKADWPGYHGLGRYHEGHAWQLDHILDAALAHGIRINLTLNNHGQGSGWVDTEWANSPYNRRNGGPLSSPEELLTATVAKQHQEQVRRYVIARYADHPAIMAWKLWSEVDFVGEQSRRREVEPLLVQWHEQAAKRWHELDVYNHPVTTHWSSNWTRVQPTLAATPGVQFLCFNLYHNHPGENEGWILAHLLQQSIASKALGRYGKPLLSTEFGGQFNACPVPQLEAEHASGAFCGLVSGLAGAPMLWWYEWIDQGSRFAPYNAIRRFIAGEDLRDPKGSSAELNTTDPGVWARAWARPGRMLGYLLDLEWQNHGITSPLHEAMHVTIGDHVTAGIMTVFWWDADSGQELSHRVLTHPGGILELIPPNWRRHLAFKLVRESSH